MSDGRSAAWGYLATLAAGDPVPTELYMLDYRDGERPRWMVHSVRDLDTGGRVLVVIDRDNGATDLFGPREPVALTVITHPNKTLRSQPHVLGRSMGNTLCDLDQQGRHVAGKAAASHLPLHLL